MYSSGCCCSTKGMSEYLVYNPKYIPRAFGLNNTGAICWFNSLLQSLLGCSSITQYMLEHESEFQDNHLAVEYIKLLKMLFEFDQDGRVVRPVESPPQAVSSASSSILSGMAKEVRRQRDKRKKLPCGQEGVQDYFNDFIDLLNSDGITRLLNNKYEYIIFCENCKQTTVTKRSNEKDLFIDMDCLREYKDRSSFTQWITNHATELDEFTCEKCGHKMKNFLRIQRLCLLREVAVIFFKWVRRHYNFWYPRNLQFKCKDGGFLTYQLVSQIEHIGSYNTLTHTSSGHYYAKSLRDRFYEFNDRSVTASDPVPTVRSQVLFYHLMPRDTVLTTDETAPVK